MCSTEMKPKGSFAWLNTTQFLGALNDNVFRWLILFFLIDHFGKERSDALSLTIAIIFVIPFLLFTPFAGKLADRFSKRSIIVLTKVWELGLMACACVALYLGWTYVMYGLLFAMCMQSAFFGPCKYGIVPELVKQERLSQANALLEGFTYLAVVLGAAGAGQLERLLGQNYATAALCCVGMAVIGLLSSFRIAHTRARGQQSSASLFFIRDVWRTLRDIRSDSALVMAVSASAFFMLLGGFLQINLIPYGVQTLGLSKAQSTDLFMIAAIGIGVGSFLAGRLSGRNVEIGIIPMGALGLALASLLLSVLSPNARIPIYVCIVVLGLSAGLFIVPVHALIQLRSPDEKRGQIVAASNFIGWVGILASAGLLGVLTKVLGLSPDQTFLVLGMLTLGLALFAVWKLPDFLVRFPLVILAKTLYRIKVVNPENVPTQGPALLVSNHVSWVDALLIGSTGQRRIRFVMSREIFAASRLKWLFRLMNVILISEADPPRQIVSSIKQARQALDDGYLVCIFAEGGITRNGMLQVFKGGLERIVKGTDYPIIPVYLGGVWGSISSYYGGKLGGWPTRIPYPVSIHFGPALPSTSTSFEARQKVSELSCDYAQGRKLKDRSLGHQFTRVARRNWSRICITDTTGKRLSYGRTLSASVLLADNLQQQTQAQDNIGILLPPTVAGTISNIAVALLGKASVNISYVISGETRQYIADQCALQTVITSRAFLEKLNFDANDPRYLFVEDLLKGVSKAAQLQALLKARLCPTAWLCRLQQVKAESLAMILFSSGSTGQPKGVQLSHFNVVSNLNAARMIFEIHKGDRLCGVLPFFHSFGLNITMWLPVTTGASVSYVPNPLDAQTVVDTVRTERASLLLATSTFLMAYMRRAKKEDFASLRSMVVSAEKMPLKLAKLFQEKFGILPQEGYGATELSPLVSVNVRDVELDGTLQTGTKLGTVGQAVPGVAVKAVDPQTFAPLGPDQPGLLLVKGPNVMQGYLHNAAKTEEVMQDGWYNTGDIAAVDTSGFITITDRLSRFSKIGGEMIPHISIEETCASLYSSDDRVLAVTSIPHEKKGEELIVLYIDGKADPEQMHQALCESDLPTLFRPKPDNFLAVPVLPVLGSGKLDIMKLKALALETKNALKA